MKQVKTKHYICYINKGTVRLSKCRKTGRFVKLVLAQAEYDKQRTRADSAIYDNVMLLAIAFAFCCLFYGFHTSVALGNGLTGFADNVVMSVLLSTFISVTWAVVAIMIKPIFINKLTVSK